MIMRAEEEGFSLSKISDFLRRLEEATKDMDFEAIKAVLLESVSGFEEHEEMYDFLWKKQKEDEMVKKMPSNVRTLFSDHGAE